MSISMKNFVKEKNEHVVGVENTSLANIREDGECDSCGRALMKGTRVLGKNVNLESSGNVRSVFSPSCLLCANMN